MKIVDEIIHDLASHRHSMRIQAFKKVDALQDLGEIKALTLKALGSPDNELALIVINKLDQSLNGRKINACTFYIWALNRLIYSRGGVLGIKSKEAIVRFCLDRNISENFKGLCFRFALGDTPYAERAFLLTQVTAQKYYAAVTFLVEQLQVGSPGEKIVAIESLVVFKDTRAIFQIRALVRHPDPLLAGAAINSLAVLGSYFDAFWLMSRFTKTPESLRPQVIATVRTLSPWLCLMLFRLIYRGAPLKLKLFVLRESALIKNSQSLNFLLRCFLKESSPVALHEALRSIYNIETQKKISTLIKKYPRASVEKKLHLLNIIADFHDERCRAFYTQLVNQESRPYIKELALQKLAFYHKPETQKLFFNLAHDRNHPLRSVAIASIFSQFSKAHKAQAFELIRALPVAHPVHAQAMKQLPSFILEGGLTPAVVDYLQNLFSLGDINQRFMVLDIFAHYHSMGIFEFLVGQHHACPPGDLRRYLLQTLSTILDAHPFYLTLHPAALPTLEVVSLLSFERMEANLLLHVCRRSLTDKNLRAAIAPFDAITRVRLARIVNDQALDFEDRRFVLIYLIEVLHFLPTPLPTMVKRDFFPYFSQPVKDGFLYLLLERNDPSDFEFLTAMSAKSLNPEVKTAFLRYAGGLL